MPSLDSLPVELIFRILNLLEIHEIIFSLRPVCRYLKDAIDNYNVYSNINLRSIPKQYFLPICSRIQPEEVTSLTLSNETPTAGEITWLFSLINVERLICLQSLTLIEVGDTVLMNLLTSIRLFKNLSKFSIIESKRRETYVSAKI